MYVEESGGSSNLELGARAVNWTKVFRESALDSHKLAENLWNADVTAATYDSGNEKYQGALLEQYKLYVEMADRVSARRALANTFFLTLNTAIFATIGVFWRDRPQAEAWFLSIPLIVLLGQCGAWYWIIRSYRQLNSAKWAVVGLMEERLPASPWWRAEWQALGAGIDRSRYWPLSHIEQWIPILFAACYLAGFSIILIAEMT